MKIGIIYCTSFAVRAHCTDTKTGSSSIVWSSPALVSEIKKNENKVNVLSFLNLEHTKTGVQLVFHCKEGDNFWPLFCHCFCDLRLLSFCFHISHIFLCCFLAFRDCKFIEFEEHNKIILHKLDYAWHYWQGKRSKFWKRPWFLSICEWIGKKTKMGYP